MLTDIDGIGPIFAEKLIDAGVNSVEKLLEHGGPKAGREKLSRNSGISEIVLLDWINMSDLFRVEGVNGPIAELLKAAGVNSVVELSKRSSRSLHSSLLMANQRWNLSPYVPREEKISDFIRQAKAMKPAVFY